MVWPFDSFPAPWPFHFYPAPGPSPVDINPRSVNIKFEVPLPDDPDKPRTYQRLIVACDGTWQDPAKKSNVYRFYDALREHDDPILLKDGKTTVRQLALYVPGVGTHGTPREILAGLIAGEGIEEYIYRGYRWLSANYNPGDEIFMIGFSRGAYTARSLAGFVHDVGLLRIKEESQFRKVFHEIFEAYKNPGPFRFNQTEQERSKARVESFRRYMETKGYGYPLYFNVPIMGIGVWDTVGSLGIPMVRNSFIDLTKRKLHWQWNREVEFHNTALGLGVQNALHALSLDEERYAFRPTLWYWPGAPEPIPDILFNPKNGEHLRRDALRKHASPPYMFIQCWFPGEHSDVGGGDDTALYQAFPYLTLLWMIDRFRSRNLLDFRPQAIEDIIADAGKRQGPSANLLKRITAYVSITGWALTLLSGLVPRKPGVWTKFDNPPKEDRDNSDAALCKAEYIHTFLRQRLAKGAKLPDSLKGFEYVDNWVKKGDWAGPVWLKRGDRAGGQDSIRIPEFFPDDVAKFPTVPDEKTAEWRLLDIALNNPDHPLWRGTKKGYAAPHGL